MDDLISRQAAIEAINHICPVDTEYDCTLLDRVDVRCVLSDLPSVQPERRYDEWCKDCKEYDHERHCCPRFNHVIRTTLQEAQKKGKWAVSVIRGNWNDEEIRTCPKCGKTFRNLDVANYCPNCGLPMEVEE